jgi:hypothetical protein
MVSIGSGNKSEINFLTYQNYSPKQGVPSQFSPPPKAQKSMFPTPGRLKTPASHKSMMTSTTSLNFNNAKF